MKHIIYTTITIISSLALSLGVAQGKGKGGGKGGGKGPDKPKVSHKGSKGKPDKSATKKPSVDKGKKAPGPAKFGDWDDQKRGAAKFNKTDRDHLLSFWDQYRGNPHGLPPGLAKNLRRGKPLPPGWQKKLTPGWRIDDEWWPFFAPVPSDFLPKDLRLPIDTGMFLLGDRLVRVHKPTREVVDFLPVPTIKL